MSHSPALVISASIALIIAGAGAARLGLLLARDHRKWATRSAERWSGWRVSDPKGLRPEKVQTAFERQLRNTRQAGYFAVFWGAGVMIWGVVYVVRALV